MGNVHPFRLTFPEQYIKTSFISSCNEMMIISFFFICITFFEPNYHLIVEPFQYQIFINPKFPKEVSEKITGQYTEVINCLSFSFYMQKAKSPSLV